MIAWTFIAILFCLVLITILKTNIYPLDIVDFAACFVVSLLITIIASLAIILPLRAIFEKDIKTNNYSTEIISLNKEYMLDGNFILGSGVISQTRYYFFYQKIGSNTFKETHIPVNDTVICEDVLETNDYPKINWITKIHESPKWLRLGIRDRHETLPISYTIHVPKNTIVRELKM